MKRGEMIRPVADQKIDNRASAIVRNLQHLADADVTVVHRIGQTQCPHRNAILLGDAGQGLAALITC